VTAPARYVICDRVYRPLPPRRPGSRYSIFGSDGALGLSICPYVSAAGPDYSLLYGLLERNVDPTIENDEGLTAAGVMKAKADVDPGTYRYERFVEMLEQARR